MTVTYAGSLYVVSWIHEHKDRHTVCKIKRLRAGCVRSSVMTSTRVHPKDQYVKETGRKYSLLAAVKLLYLDKPGRTAILQAYFNRKVNRAAPKLAKVPRCRNCESNPAQTNCASCNTAVCSACHDTDGNCLYCSVK